MSFWKESPGPTWSDWFSSLVACTGTPLAQPIRRYPLALSPPASDTIQYCFAKPNDSPSICEFLSEYFQITQNSICCLPVERLTRGIQSDWIVLVAREGNKIIGTVISRLLGSLVFQIQMDSEQKQSRFSSADYIDFFCVHPDYRKSGVGSELLKQIDFYASERGRPIHFFQKEITPLFVIPPLWHGTYIFRECVLSGSTNRRVNFFHHQVKRNPKTRFELQFANPKSSQDSRYYVNDCGNFKVHLAITNTYHMYQNAWLGEVLFYSVENADDTVQEKNIAAAIEEIIEAAGYRYILMDESIPHLKQFNWIRDASYFIYAYNVNPRKFFSVKPEFWF
jgi:GNAT superfamily N-acetyltransferase